jgi:hypothetical protein
MWVAAPSFKVQMRHAVCCSACTYLLTSFDARISFQLYGTNNVNDPQRTFPLILPQSETAFEKPLRPSLR